MGIHGDRIQEARAAARRKVRTARLGKCLTFQALAEAADLSLSAVRDVETGHDKGHHLTTIKAIAAALDIPAGELLCLYKHYRPEDHDVS